MKRNILILAALPLLAGAAPSWQQKAIASAAPFIDKANSEWETAIVRGKADVMSAPYSKNAVFIMPDGTAIDGLDGLRNYLLTKRRDAFVRQFTRKLLGYALGRAVQLSDEPLLKEIQTKVAANDYHVGVAIDAIVRSKQFREIRGKDVAFDE